MNRTQLKNPSNWIQSVIVSVTLWLFVIEISNNSIQYLSWDLKRSTAFLLHILTVLALVTAIQGCTMLDSRPLALPRQLLRYASERGAVQLLSPITIRETSTY